MGCGLPVVASAVGMNKEVVDENINGFLVETEEQWFEKLSLLIENSILRKEFGNKGRIKIESDYDIQKKHNVLLSILANES
jgi:glycosyltransferase involved in cell wall biosynthesis